MTRIVRASDARKHAGEHYIGYETKGVLCAIRGRQKILAELGNKIYDAQCNHTMRSSDTRKHVGEHYTEYTNKQSAMGHRTASKNDGSARGKIHHEKGGRSSRR